MRVPRGTVVPFRPPVPDLYLQLAEGQLAEEAKARIEVEQYAALTEGSEFMDPRERRDQRMKDRIEDQRDRERDAPDPSVLPSDDDNEVA